MKRKGMLLSALVAVLLSICFVSCSQDDEMGIGLSTGDLPSQERSVSVSNEVASEESND